jgi:hypothetical protein
MEQASDNLLFFLLHWIAEVLWFIENKKVKYFPNTCAFL